MQITLFAVGTLKESYLKEAFSAYAKRISAYATFKEIVIPETRIPDEEDPKKIGAALTEEGEKLLAACPRDAYKVALCVEGKQLSSEDLATLVGEAGDAAGKLALFIGSSHGLSDAVKGACDYRLSFSKMTFPHSLARVIAAECLYRSLTILAGKKYHK